MGRSSASSAACTDRRVGRSTSSAGARRFVSAARTPPSPGRPPAASTGFRRLPPDWRVHVLTPPARKPVDATWVAAYRTAAIRDQDIVAATRRHQDHEPRPDRARPRPLRTTRRPSVDHRADHARRPPHRRGDDGGRRRLHVAAAAMDHHVSAISSTRRAGGAPAESDPEVRIGAALLAAGISGLERQHRDRSPGLRTGAVRPRRAVAPLGDRGRRASGPPRDRGHHERSPPRRAPPRRWVGRRRASPRTTTSSASTPPSPTSFACTRDFAPSRSHATPKRCRCGARLTRHRHRSGSGQVGDVDVGLD